MCITCQGGEWVEDVAPSVLHGRAPTPSLPPHHLPSSACGCRWLTRGKKRPRELRQFVADLSHSQRIVRCVRQRTEFESQTGSEWLRFAESRSSDAKCQTRMNW